MARGFLFFQLFLLKKNFFLVAIIVLVRKKLISFKIASKHFNSWFFFFFFFFFFALTLSFSFSHRFRHLIELAGQTLVPSAPTLIYKEDDPKYAIQSNLRPPYASFPSLPLVLLSFFLLLRTITANCPAHETKSFS
jgi:hypothetical protein